VSEPIGAKRIRRLEYRARSLAVYVPPWARHPLAKTLRAVSETVRHADAATSSLRARFSLPWTEVFQLFLQTAIAVDVKVPCPHCDRPTPLSELELLKTYCYGCSDWGFPPPSAREEAPT
jgi:hypothetical protein